MASKAMREQTPAAPAPSAAPSAEAGAASFLRQLGGGGDALSAAPRPTGKFRGVVLLGGVILCAGGLLLGMRHMGMNGDLNLEEIKIDYPIEKAEALVADSSHTRVLDDLKGGAVVQVPLESVQMNPFAWRIFGAAEVEEEPSDAAQAAERDRKEREAKEKAVAAAADKLRLTSVMGGSVPVAQISGEVVRVGDTVGGMFKVVDIKGRAVALECEGKTFMLSMDEEKTAKPKR